MKKEWEYQEEYDEFLDDIYGTVMIGGYEYNTSYALKEVDRIAYDEGYHDWRDALPEEEGEEE